jgi:alkylation response protein AidB-like acyl-CoA dehydrogenase
VDFELTADQQALQEGVRKLCEGRIPMARVRATQATAGVARDIWRELGDAGVFSLRLPEGDGGVGLGMADAVLVYEELGRALVPGPLAATQLAAGLIDGAAGGGRVVGLVDRRSPILLVEHLEQLDDLLAVDGDGVWLVEPAPVLSGGARPVGRRLDPLTSLHQVEPAQLSNGVRLGGPDLVARLELEGSVLTAALMLGLAAATTELATSYARERVQFDRPIGSFQAVKHLLADMLVRAELARAATYAAGVTLDEPSVGDPAVAAAAAKVMAADAALQNGKTCIQVHGGMGFTWEVDAHLYLKRAWVLETHFGTVDDHTEALAQRL